VKKAAIETLGGMKSPDALEELHKLYWGDRSLSKDPIVFALVLKAIGRHGDKSSIKVLMDSPFNNLTLDSGRARLLGMARIRDDDAVEELVKLSRAGGGRQRSSGLRSSWRGVFTEDFRTAIVVLTGEEYGRDKADLETWWRAWRAKKAPRVPAERPQIDPKYSERFEKYWGENYYADAKKAPPPASLQPPIEIVDNPTPEQVKTALARFDDAFKAKDADLLASTIEEFGGIADDKVVHELARALRFRDKQVRTHAVIALGWVPDDDALRQLHRMYRREKDLGKTDEALFAQLLKSIGRHGDRRSISVLSDKPLKYHTLESSRARIYGLGNIRRKEAVEELIKGMQLIGSAGVRGARSFKTESPRAMEEFNVALSVLTGFTVGTSQQLWLDWWRENKSKLKVSPTRPPVPDDIKRAWERYWNAPY
jgi:HEAT repeat protein